MNPDLLTRADLATLVPDGGLMVELGVAAGEFALALMARNPNAVYLGIDRYTDHHGEGEFRRALDLISRAGGWLHRCTFAEAFDRLETLADLVYIDGYAHTGQEGGQTIRQWWDKVRPGGILAGHDYHPQWQPTVDAVDDFVARHGLALHLIFDEPFPSWWVRKPNTTTQGGQSPSLP